ncbi:hypothetical protein E3E23_03600 [Thermococcus sp. CX2]|uniref:hypothetical protein n=1 Tax=Thermococcus sp. CX2 TaxID=163006 RepID=UPI001439DA3E|nr:hypothetical protein [Thermococcus sp. CX2]NJE84921.1 hypothetical protein [Thermococcus sp. CX2]
MEKRQLLLYLFIISEAVATFFYLLHQELLLRVAGYPLWETYEAEYAAYGTLLLLHGFFLTLPTTLTSNQEKLRHGLALSLLPLIGLFLSGLLLMIPVLLIRMIPSTFPNTLSRAYSWGGFGRTPTHEQR